MQSTCIDASCSLRVPLPYNRINKIKYYKWINGMSAIESRLSVAWWRYENWTSCALYRMRKKNIPIHPSLFLHSSQFPSQVVQKINPRTFSKSTTIYMLRYWCTMLFGALCSIAQTSISFIGNTHYRHIHNVCMHAITIAFFRCANFSRCFVQSPIFAILTQASQT